MLNISSIKLDTVTLMAYSVPTSSTSSVRLDRHQIDDLSIPTTALSLSRSIERYQINKTMDLCHVPSTAIIHSYDQTRLPYTLSHEMKVKNHQSNITTQQSGKSHPPNHPPVHPAIVIDLESINLGTLKSWCTKLDRKMLKPSLLSTWLQYQYHTIYIFVYLDVYQIEEILCRWPPLSLIHKIFISCKDTHRGVSKFSLEAVETSLLLHWLRPYSTSFTWHANHLRALYV